MTVLPDSVQGTDRTVHLSWRAIAVILVAAAVAVGGVFAFGGFRSKSSPLAGRSAAQIAQLTATDMLASGSVRSVETDIAPGHANSVTVTLAGTTDGAQTVTYGKSFLAARVIGSTTYVQANTLGWENLGLTTQFASALSARSTWIALRAGDTDYTEITDGDTVPLIVKDMAFTGALTLVPQTVADGHKVVGLRGSVSGAGASGVLTEWVSVRKHPLPVALTGTINDDSFATAFSNWGDPPTVSAPADAVSPDDLARAQAQTAT